ncbi:helix-turn-helix transcriptional regulator [Candidatus Palauibacter sp.]|uniref:helix-turn-helix transcriptional regulator n=1 Tax=Candidatus Palauibacter sp. TaxID=3101350 RepID=UPI003D122023
MRDNSILNGRASLSPKMALRLEKALAVSTDMLLRMQACYDAARLRARAGEIHVRRYETA